MLQGHNVVFIYENPHTNMFEIDQNNPMFFKINFPTITNKPTTFQTGVMYPCGCAVAINNEIILGNGGKPPIKFHKNPLTKEVSAHCPHCLKKIS